MKAEIIVHRVDDSYCWVECENHIAYSLSEFFTFFVPGYKFMPSFKNKQWDGTIKLFRLRNRELYTGLAIYVKDFANNNGFTCSIDDDVLEESDIAPDDIANYVTSLNLQSGGKSITPRDYQQFAIYHALKKKRALMLSPTSSGKSLMIYGICRAIQNISQKKILVLVPTTGLVAQMTGDFKDYSTANGWVCEDNVHQIIGGKEKSSEKQIYISTWQSLFRMSKSYFQQFGTLIVDEAHQATANSIKGIAEKMTNCSYKLGFTGTLNGMKTSQLVLEGLLGKVQKVITTRKLMDNKTVAELSIKALMLTYNDDEKKMMRKAKYQEEIKWLFTLERRNKFCARLAVLQKKNCLLMFNHIEHGKAILKQIEKILGPDSKRKVYFVTGSMGGEERNKIRENIEKEKDSIILGSVGVFSTGVSIKNLHTVIFSSPTKSKIRTLQSIGRGLRINAEKSAVTLYDIVDDLSIKKHKNYALEHFMERADYYYKEQFDFTIKRITI